jgi:hypothetical protein
MTERECRLATQAELIAENDRSCSHVDSARTVLQLSRYARRLVRPDNFIATEAVSGK